MSTETVHTYCRICLSNCGLDVTVDTDANRVLRIEPDRANPHTWRDFCRKGKVAHEMVEHPRRLTTPMRRVGDRYEPATWEEATEDIARRLNEIIERDGADAVGSYHGNPMGFAFGITSFWTGFLDAIGTGNRFWVGSIDQNNSHIVAEELYGSELVALPPDIPHCRCFLLVGMDPAVSKFNWMDNAPDGWNRVLDRQRDGAEIIVVDPRRSATAARADTHVAILPGTDWAFLLGVVKVVLDEGLEARSTALPLNGLDDIRALTRPAELGDLATRCGVDAEVIAGVARRFAGAPGAMCMTHTGVSHNEHGTIGEWLGHVLNLICDRIDTPGGRRFECGYVDMAKIMAMFAPPTKHRTRLRDLPTILGFHALSELPDEITTPGPGQIKAMIIGFGNPVTSGPDGQALDAALEQLELLVCVDLVQRESHRHADWLIPGTHWLEREELNPLLANLQDAPYVQYARRTVDPPAGIKEEWEFFTDLALAMNRNMFGRPGTNRIIRATRRVARWTGRPQLAMNPEWVQRLLVAMGRKLKWKDILAHPHGWSYARPQYGNMAATLRTPDKRVHLAPDLLVQECRRALAAPPATSARFPLLLSNKRRRESMNSWLNESPSLYKIDRGIVMEMHPADAEAAGLGEGDIARVSSAVGELELPVHISEAMRTGVVCIPHGWGTRTFDPDGTSAPESFGANRNLLVDNVRIDRLSQTPAFNSTAVRVEAVASAQADVDAGDVGVLLA